MSRFPSFWCVSLSPYAVSPLPPRSTTLNRSKTKYRLPFIALAMAFAVSGDVGSPCLIRDRWEGEIPTCLASDRFDHPESFIVRSNSSAFAISSCPVVVDIPPHPPPGWSDNKVSTISLSSITGYMLHEDISRRKNGTFFQSSGLPRLLSS